jgi:O-antigen/teichoic acid export membrane protein
MLITGIARALQFAMLLLTLRVATTLLPPAEMGKVAVVTATVAFFTLLLLNPVGMFINRRMHAWDARGMVRRYLGYFWLYLVFVAGFSILLLLVLNSMGWWHPAIAIVNLIVLVAASIACGTLNQATIPWLNLIGGRGWFAILTVATTIIGLLLATVMVESLDPTAEYWITGLMLGQFAVGMAGIYIFYGRLRPGNTLETGTSTVDRQKIKGLVAFAWPLALAVSLGWIQSQSYRFIAEQKMGLIQLGLFVTGFGIAAGISAGFESVISTYFQPIFYKKVNSTDREVSDGAWTEYAASVLPSMALTAFLIVALASELTQLLLGPAYQDSYQYVRWGALAELARMSTGVFALFAHAKMMTKILIYPNLLGAILSVVLVWVFIDLFATDGIGFALALSSLATFVLTFFITIRFVSIAVVPKSIMVLLAMGAALWFIPKLMHVVLGEATGLLSAGVVAFATGITFLAFQFSLLKSVFKTRSHLLSTE